MKNVYIIGGGPAGMMAAISAKEHHMNANVILIERNNVLGKKLKMTGGGRCNVSAAVSNEEVIKHTIQNGKFLYSALMQFNTSDIATFFENLDCPLKIEDHHRMFPKSDDANDIIFALKRRMKELNIKIEYNTFIEKLTSDEIYANHKAYPYDYLILATGGCSYATSGSDGSGYILAKQLGHHITPLQPAQVPLVSNDEVIQSKVLQGLSFQNVSIKVLQKNKVKYQVQHDLIFTHFGISGPSALQASDYVQKVLKKENPVTIQIDFICDVSLENLQHELKETSIEDIFRKYQLSKRLYTYLKSQTTKNMDILTKLKTFPLTIYTTRGFHNAFVTSGGIHLKEVDPKTMKSKLHPHIAFCGEVLDMHAHTGGYNITIALVSGYVAGKYIM